MPLRTAALLKIFSPVVKRLFHYAIGTRFNFAHEFRSLHHDVISHAALPPVRRVRKQHVMYAIRQLFAVQSDVVIAVAVEFGLDASGMRRQ